MDRRHVSPAIRGVHSQIDVSARHDRGIFLKGRCLGKYGIVLIAFLLQCAPPIKVCFFENGKEWPTY